MRVGCPRRAKIRPSALANYQLAFAQPRCYKWAMKKLIKWVIRILFVLVLIIVGLLLVRDSIAKSVAEKQILAQTGMKATIGKFHIGLADPVVTIENLRMFNPPGFDNSRFVDIPEIHVEYDRGALFSRRLHFTLVRFNLADVSVVENAEGKTNLEFLQEKQKQKGASTSTAKSEPALKFVGIDTLNLTLGRVRFSSVKHPERAKEIKLDVKNAELKNVKSAKDFSGLIAGIMMKNGVNFLGEGVSAATDAAAGVIKDAGAAAAQDTGRKLLDTIASPFKKKQ